MLQTIHFTKDVIQKLKISPTRFCIADRKTPNLRIYVYPSGVKTFVLCRKVNGKSQKIKIGRTSDLTIEQARKEAERLNSHIALGTDIQADKQEKRRELTFKDLYEIYYNEHAIPFTKGARDNRNAVELHIFPPYGSMKGSEITLEKIRRFHIGLTKTMSKASANRILAQISATFNFCIKNSYFKGPNPCAGVKKFRETSRDRFLTTEELEKFFAAVEKEDELFRDFFLMLIFSGARKSNVKSMKWADIDFNNKRWRISEAETKNSDVNIVMLCDPALDILKSRYAKNNLSENPSSFVFPGKGKNGYVDDPKKAFRRIRQRMDVTDFRIHDLRRTLGSYMAIGGASLPIIGKALNHKSQISTAIYARLSQEPVLDAVNSAVKMITGQKILDQFRQNIEMVNINLGDRYFNFYELV